MKSILKGLLFLYIAVINLPVLATDGDVVYSAPYIWVNPETGQIETVNPGPRLKAHEAMTSTETSEQTATEVMESESAGSEMATHETAAAHTPIMHPLVVLIGIVATIGLMVGMGRKSA
jgi:hypothetical protein